MVNFNDLFSSGDPRRGSATVNGREISLTALSGIADEALISGIQNGSIQMSQNDLNQLAEIRQMEGRSGLFNFLNGVGQDIGVVGETGVGALERGGRLASFIASLYAGGRLLGASRFLPSTGVLSQARNIPSPGAALSTLRNAFSTRNVGLAAGGALATGAIAQGIAGGGGDEPIRPSVVGGVDPSTEAVFDGGVQAGETGEEVTVDVPAGGDPNNPFALGGAGGQIRITPIEFEGQRTGLLQLTFPDGTTEFIGEDELPINNPDLIQRQRMLEDFTLAERRFNQAITALNTISSIRSAQGGDERANAQFQLALAETLADPRSAAILRAGIARQPQGSSISPLIAAFTDTRPGDITLSDTGLSGQLAQLFGLQAGQDIPVPGASRTTPTGEFRPVTVNEGGGITSTVGSPTFTREVGQQFNLQQIPLNNVLSSLSSDERGLFDALLTISGTNPEDVARKQQQLAPPGSGRSVFAAFQ